MTDWGTDEIERTRRCTRDHAGSHLLDALDDRGNEFECQSCRTVYMRAEALALPRRVIGSP